VTAEWGSLGDGLAQTCRENPELSEDECKELILDAIESGWVAWRQVGEPTNIKRKREDVEYTVTIEVNLPGLAAHLKRDRIGLETAIRMMMTRTGKSRRQARAFVMKAVKDGKLDVHVTHPAQDRQ
jgi:hypothetical protein